LSLLTLGMIYFYVFEHDIFHNRIVNEYDSLRCINKAIEIDEKDLDYTLSKDY
jgi:hypothetical protein